MERVEARWAHEESSIVRCDCNSRECFVPGPATRAIQYIILIRHLVNSLPAGLSGAAASRILLRARGNQ